MAHVVGNSELFHWGLKKNSEWLGTEQSTSHYLNHSGWRSQWINTLRPEQNSWHVADAFSLLKSSLKFVPQGPIGNKSALVQPQSETCWPRSAKPCGITRLQWVNMSPGAKEFLHPLLLRMAQLFLSHIIERFLGHFLLAEIRDLLKQHWDKGVDK